MAANWAWHLVESKVGKTAEKSVEHWAVLSAVRRAASKEAHLVGLKAEQWVEPWAAHSGCCLVEQRAVSTVEKWAAHLAWPTVA